MKKLISFLVFQFILTVSISAQKTTDIRRLNRGVESAVEKALKDAEATQKKVEEAKHQTEQRHEQLRIQQQESLNASMNNLNQVSIGDFVTAPRQENGSGTDGNERGAQRQNAPVAIRRTVTANRSVITAERSNFGTLSESGNHYTEGRYDTSARRSLPNSQRVQEWNDYGSLETIRENYQDAATDNGRSRKVSLRENVGVSSDASISRQMLQEIPGTAVRDNQPLRRMNNKGIYIPKGMIMSPQSNHSSDLAPVDITLQRDNSTSLPLTNHKVSANEAANNKMREDGVQGVTEHDLFNQMRKEFMSGDPDLSKFTSYEYAGKIKTSNVVIKKR